MNINNNMSEVTARKSRHFFYFSDIVLPLLLFVITIILFRDSKLDLIIQSMFYHPQTGWFLKDYPIFWFVYHFGNIPALLLSITGLVFIWLSFQAMKWVKWRKVGLFLFLAMLLGPGLIINVVLKDNWGRPRPRNTVEFGGKYVYEKVLSIDRSSPGNSFPCGHASMGFFLFIPWFVLRKKHNALARLSLITGISYGLLIGLARVAQGGHYASDVMIAGILTYLTGTGLFYLLKMNRAIWYYPRQEIIDSKQRTMVSVTVSILFFFLVMGVVLATPYSKTKTYASKQSSLQKPQATVLTFNLKNAELKLMPSDSTRVALDTQGFGFPGSKLNSRFQEQVSSDTMRIDFSQTKKGFFSELINELNSTFNFPSHSRINLNLDKGTATIVLPDSLEQFSLDIDIHKGKLDLDLPAGFKPKIKLKGDFKLTDNTGFNSADSIYVKPEFNINIIVREGEVILR
jgi:lipid A 4'-phosphatase